MGKGVSSENLAVRVGILVAFMTVAVTAINGVPAFLALYGKEPYVAYEIGRSQMLYPEDADRQAIRRLLGERRIPDAFATMSLSNRGDIPAQKVVVSLSVPGQILAEQTEPRLETKPAWVTVSKELDAEKDPSRIRYTLSNLGLARTYSIKVSFISEPLGDARWEIFYDGKRGVLVEDLSLVPENARAISLVPTLKILGFGLLLSALAYLILRYREVIRQSRFFRMGSEISAVPKWRRYKNDLVFELGKFELVRLCSTTDGSPDSTDSQGFWDAVFEIVGKRCALEVHISNQHWSGIMGNTDDQRAYCLRVHAMAQSTDPSLTHVVLVNDKEVWSSAPAANLVGMFKELGGGVQFDFISGHPEEAARRVLEVVAERAA